MKGLSDASIQLANLKGIEKILRDIDRFITYYAGRSERAPEEIKVNKVVYDKIKKKGLVLANKQSDGEKIKSVQVFHRGSRIISE